jgi:uncharacterized protein YbjT (DUF2867 family)
MRIAVAGATGRVGRHVVDVAEQRGHEVVPMSRATGVDVITRAGLDEALTGVDCIVDATTGPSPEKEAATEFFTTASRNLHDAGARAGVDLLVVVSIINTDRLAGGYAAAKVAHEQAALAGPIPARILRAAQFHEFVEQLMGWGRQGDVCYLPNMRTQLVAARTVGEELVELATTAEVPAGPIPEIAGPREEILPEMARLLAARRGDPVKIEAVRNPDDPDAEANESGVLLPSPHAKLAGPTFDEWLAAGT